MEPNRQTVEHLQERLLRKESRLNADTSEMTALAAMRINKVTIDKDSKTKDKGKKKKLRGKKDVEA